CGADAVVCHHPHVPGAYEFYKKKPVIYSLGNLIFDALKPRPGWNEGYAAKISFNLCEMKLSDCEFIPYKQSVEFGGIQKLKGTEKDNFLLQLKNYNETLSNEPDYTKEWENFCAKNAKKVLLNMFSPIRFRGLSRINRVIDLVKFVFPKSLKLLRLNYVRCESHRELLEHILEKKC
ncbi:MAG: CapA family protein, partial [Nanoarchaeota archaeon]